MWSTRLRWYSLIMDSRSIAKLSLITGSSYLANKTKWASWSVWKILTKAALFTSNHHELERNKDELKIKENWRMLMHILWTKNNYIVTNHSRIFGENEFWFLNRTCRPEVLGVIHVQFAGEPCRQDCTLNFDKLVEYYKTCNMTRIDL